MHVILHNVILHNECIYRNIAAQVQLLCSWGTQSYFYLFPINYYVMFDLLWYVGSKYIIHVVQLITYFILGS